MPYKSEWVPPALFIEHGGVKIYCTYRRADFDQGPREYGFSLDPNCGEEECDCREEHCRNVFDVRKLPNWTESPHPPFLIGPDHTPENRKAWDAYYENAIEENHIKKIIREAIDRGLLHKAGP